MGSKTNTKSCHLFPQDINLFPGFIICFMHKGSELPCYRKRFYSWLSVYSLAYGGTVARTIWETDPPRQNNKSIHERNTPKKAGIWKTKYQNLSKQLIHQKPATPTGPTDDFSQKSLTLTLTSEMLSEVDLSGRAEGWEVETGKTGKTHCCLGFFGECLRSHTSLHMYSRWTRTASHRSQNQFRWFSKQHFHTFLLFPWLYIYIYVYQYIQHFTSPTKLI